jgi:hypothetical protein
MGTASWIWLSKGVATGGFAILLVTLCEDVDSKNGATGQVTQCRRVAVPKYVEHNFKLMLNVDT